jgi:hypothetical protein
MNETVVIHSAIDGLRLAGAVMRRDQQTIEAELMEISAIQDDSVKLERIVAWCATYPDEILFALGFFRERKHLNRSDGNSTEKH